MKRDYLEGGGRENEIVNILKIGKLKKIKFWLWIVLDETVFLSVEVISNFLCRGSICDNGSYLVTLVMKAAF